jgi:hypothetical protein
MLRLNTRFDCSIWRLDVSVKAGLALDKATAALAIVNIALPYRVHVDPDLTEH